MTPDAQKKLIEFLGKYVTKNKNNLITNALEYRTRYITIVLEDIYKPQNASATLRTCECLGIQDIYIIENKNKYQINPKVTLGSSKWLNLYRYNSTQQDNTSNCINHLRKAGYHIVATSPNFSGHTLQTLPLEKKVAFLFGNEEEGLSDRSFHLSDDYLKLPMFGFTHSYNISVSVAITLFFIAKRLRDSGILWQLSPEEKNELTLIWYKRIIPQYEALKKAYIENVVV